MGNGQQIAAQKAKDNEGNGVGQQVGEVNVQKRRGENGGQAEEMARANAKERAQHFEGQHVKDIARPHHGQKSQKRVTGGVLPQGREIREHLP